MSETTPICLAISLLKVLSHQVRNPLNIISNDLNYLKIKYPHENYDRSLQRCKQIADSLRIFEKLVESSETESDFSELLKNIFEDKARIEKVCRVSADFVRLRHALEWIKLALNPQHVLQADDGAYRFIIDQQVHQSCGNFNQLCCALGQTESILPILADAIFDSYGFKFLAQPGFFQLYR